VGRKIIIRKNRNIMVYKTLEFIDRKKQLSFGRYVILINESELGGCDIPQLMNLETTMRKLKKSYPKQYFDDVRLILLKVNEIETNNT